MCHWCWSKRHCSASFYYSSTGLGLGCQMQQSHGLPHTKVCFNIQGPSKILPSRVCRQSSENNQKTPLSVYVSITANYKTTKFQITMGSTVTCPAKYLEFQIMRVLNQRSSLYFLEDYHVYATLYMYFIYSVGHFSFTTDETRSLFEFQSSYLFRVT